MMASNSKRFLAYVIDILLIGIIIAVISKPLVDNKKIILLNQQLNEVNETILNSDMKFTQNFKNYAQIVKQIDLENVLVNIFTIIMILIYFVFVPYYNNGQTLGSKILKTKIVTRDGSPLTITKLMVRNFILNGLLYLAICLAFLYLFSGIIYFIMISILSFIQLGLAITSVFMILYRKDKRGLQDILSETKIMEISGE
ncbi:MAG TPA: RDD family protein [Mollicutes bacterium]|nr:RDD family protein [Mollicutes bacterium]